MRGECVAEDREERERIQRLFLTEDDDGVEGVEEDDAEGEGGASGNL